MPTRRRALLFLIALALLALASGALALAVGSVRVPLAEVFATLLGNGSNEVVRSLRLPRALSGFACGGLLALSGALLQVLLRNPLADPYVLGVSGGASVGALLAMLFGFAAAGINGLAFAGALSAMLVVFGLSRGDGSWTQTRLLLPASALAGGTLLVLADTLARSVIAPQQLPVGVLTALIGVPAFLLLLARDARTK